MLTFVASEVHCTAGDHERSADCAYQIAWSINPHMVVGATQPWRAAWQHGALVRTVRSLGAQVIKIPFVHGAFDSVFAKDNAIYRAGGAGPEAILASPLHAVRLREQQARLADLRRDTMVTGTISDEVDEVLTACAKRVVHVELDEFQRSGGSAACLLARVHGSEMQAATAAMRSTAAYAGVSSSSPKTSGSSSS